MKRFWIVGLLIVLLGIGGYFFWNGQPGKTPLGQASLIEMNASSLDLMKAEFNKEADAFRIVVLLSPT